MPLKTKHICFYTTKDHDEITLMEMIEEVYPHPDAPQEAVIQLITYRVICSHTRTTERAANMVLLEAAQKACQIYDT